MAALRRTAPLRAFVLAVGVLSAPVAVLGSMSCNGNSNPSPSTVVTAIVLNPANVTIAVGATSAISAMLTFADGSMQTIGGGAVVASTGNDGGVPLLEWLSTDQSVVTVDEVGNVMANGPGQATITVIITTNPLQDSGAPVLGASSVTVPAS